MWSVQSGLRQWANSLNEYLALTVAFSPDDHAVAQAFINNAIIMHDAVNGAGVRFEGHTAPINKVAFSPDNTLLASASDDGTARIWTNYYGSTIQIFTGHSGPVTSVDFSPDGQLVASAGADGTARIWNVTNAEQLVVMEGGGGTAKFAADGKYLFSLSDYTFKIWRVANGAFVGSITNTLALCFDIAKNGKYFAYGTANGAVVLARMPLIIDEFFRTGNQTILKWQGGSGLYQLQSRTNFFGGFWENFGAPTTNTVATNVNSSTIFYRVQSVPVP